MDSAADWSPRGRRALALRGTRLWLAGIQVGLLVLMAARVLTETHSTVVLPIIGCAIAVGVFGSLAVHCWRIGIEIAQDGVVVRNLVATKTLSWRDVRGFEAGVSGVTAAVKVLRVDGRPIVIDGLRTYGNRIALEPYLAELNAALERAQRSGTDSSR